MVERPEQPKPPGRYQRTELFQGAAQMPRPSPRDDLISARSHRQVKGFTG